MGGELEETIDVGKAEDGGGVLEPPTSSPPEQTATIPAVGSLKTPIRYHLNGGFIHFHDDQSKLRVAIPVAEWWCALESLKHLRDEDFRYIDHDAGTMLEVSAGINENNQFDIIPEVKKVSSGVGPIFKKLEAFTAKARKK
jgi:hypothetical protein